MANEQNVWTAFAAAQKKFKAPEQSGRNPHFKSRYSTLADIFNATLPAIRSEGLVFSQMIQATDNGALLISTILLPEKPETRIESIVPLVLDSNPQKLGSYLSYMKRYAAAAMFAVVDGMDDDAEAVVQDTRKQHAEVNFSKTQNGNGSGEPVAADALENEDMAIIDGWLADGMTAPVKAKEWAVTMKACNNEYEASNSLKKIVDNGYGGKLNTDNLRDVLKDFYKRQTAKLKAKKEA